MKIKTFPLQFVDVELEEIKKVAKNKKISAKEFMMQAIREKVQKEKGE